MGLFFLLAYDAITLTWPVHLPQLTRAGTSAVAPTSLPSPPDPTKLEHGKMALSLNSELQPDPVPLKSSTITLPNLFHSRCEEECSAFTFSFLSCIEGNEATSTPIISTIQNLSNNEAYGQLNMHKLISSCCCLIKCHTYRVPDQLSLLVHCIWQSQICIYYTLSGELKASSYAEIIHQWRQF